jgi:UrcA family protein
VIKSVSHVALSAVGAGLACFAALALLLAPVAAAAAVDAGAGPSIRVAIADLDLSTEEGRARLDRRIHRAAEQVCNAGTARSLHLSAYPTDCVERAKFGAASQIATLIGLKA